MHARAGLTRERLISAALDIVDRDGLEALSMRRLGAELGVDPMAAYRHLPSKEALLDGVVEAVISGVDLTTDAAADWQVQVRQMMRAYLDALLAHPNALPLIAERPWKTPGSLRVLERALQILQGSGASLHDALVAVNAIGFFTSGLALAAGARQREPYAEEQQVRDLLALPVEEFPVIHEVLRSDQVVRGYGEVIDFAIEAIITRMDHITAS